MIVATTPSVGGCRITACHGVITGRSVVVEIDLGHGVINKMLMVPSSGTAVMIE